MPGFYGSLPRTAHGDALAEEFAAVWPGTVRCEVEHGLLGAHAHGGKGALHALAGGSRLAVDGDARLLAAGAGRDISSRLGAHPDRSGAPSLPCAGSLAWYQPAAGRCRLAVDWTGSFPLYVAERGGALLFSTLLRPLARALDAPPDPVGIAEFILHDYTLAGRTLRAGIRRLLPGQILDFDLASGRSAIQETSRLWIGTESSSGRELADHAWELLVAAVRDGLDAAPAQALMLSAGWDSRLLLAAMSACGRDGTWSAYTHGDPRSRELRTVSAMCRALGVRWRHEPLGPGAFETGFLQQVMARAECILFPPWSRAGSLLASAGATAITAGVYGEVLGGHYSPAGLASGTRRMIEIARTSLPRSGAPPDGNAGAARLRGVFQRRHTHEPRFVTPPFLDGRGPARDAMDADLEHDLNRLHARGIATAEQFVEAFIAEHRGTQYINGQALAARPWLDVSLPFADRELVALASRVPLRAKIQNALHRRILERRARPLLRHPTAAILLPAWTPIVAQEASRLARWAVEKARWRLSAATRGRVAPDRSGWWNFEFLRGGEEFGAMRRDLQGDLWDRSAVDRWISGVAGFADRRPVYPDILLKAYAVDLALR